MYIEARTVLTPIILIYTQLFTELNFNNRSHILILRDFNMKEINWESNSTTSSANHIATQFLQTTRDHFLHQHVQAPTRHREGNTPLLLDLILTNEEGMVNNIEYKAGLGQSDHILIKFDFICYTHRDTG